MQVLVTYGGDPIPKSPFTVGVAAPLDLSKIKINGLENSKLSNEVRGPATVAAVVRPPSDGAVFRDTNSVLERCCSGRSWA